MARNVERVMVYPERARINGTTYEAGDVVVLGSVSEFEALERRTRCRFLTKREFFRGRSGDDGADLRGLAEREA